MRVLHVTPYYPPEIEFGGPPASVHELCRALRRQGVEVHVVTTGRSDARETVDDVAVSRVRRRTRLGFGAAVDAVLDEQLPRADVCHIHAMFNWPAWRAAGRARHLARPFVVSPRGMLEPAALQHHRWRKQMAWRAIDRRAIAHASAVVASTSSEAATLRARGIDSVVIANGIDLPATMPARGQFRLRHGLAGERPIVLFLGRLHPIKRLDLLAQAFVDVAARQPNALLVLAGPDECGLWPSLQRQLTAIGERACWIGAVDASAKWQLLVDSDVLVLCSDSESYGRVVGEGLAAGVPVVVTDTCPWPALGRLGLGRTVPQTATAIADAISELLADDPGRHAMRRRTSAYARVHLAWDSIVQQYVELYEAVRTSSRAAALAAQGST